MLTETAVRNAKPADKPRKFADERGLYLLVHPNGSRYWRFKYRHDVPQRTRRDDGQLVSEPLSSLDRADAGLNDLGKAYVVLLEERIQTGLAGWDDGGRPSYLSGSTCL